MKHGLTNKELKFLICDYWCVKYMLRKLNQRQKLHYSAKDETSEAISGFSRILAASSTKLEANTPDSTVELVKTGWNPIQRSAQISSRFLCNSILLDQNFLTESCEFVHLDRRQPAIKNIFRLTGKNSTWALHSYTGPGCPKFARVLATSHTPLCRTVGYYRACG